MTPIKHWYFPTYWARTWPKACDSESNIIEEFKFLQDHLTTESAVEFCTNVPCSTGLSFAISSHVRKIVFNAEVLTQMLNVTMQDLKRHRWSEKWSHRKSFVSEWMKNYATVGAQLAHQISNQANRKNYCRNIRNLHPKTNSIDWNNFLSPDIFKKIHFSYLYVRLQSEAAFNWSSISAGANGFSYKLHRASSYKRMRKLYRTEIDKVYLIKMQSW